MGNQDFLAHSHSWYHKAWWEEKIKAFQGNLLNYVTSRLTKRHGQTVHLQRPVVITVYKRKLSLFREVNISFSENGRWFLFIHPSQRALFFLAPFALLLHKYTHMFIREMGSPLSCALPASLLLLPFSFLNVVLVPLDSAADLYVLAELSRDLRKKRLTEINWRVQGSRFRWASALSRCPSN